MISDDDRDKINEAQLVLAEKRTNLAAIRTGIAVSALPLGVVSFLIAMSEKYHYEEIAHYLVPLLFVCGCLACLGFFLIIRSTVRVIQNDRMLKSIKKGPQLLDSLLK